MRDKVWARDRGICAGCGVQCDFRQRHSEELSDLRRATEKLFPNRQLGDSESKLVYMIANARDNMWGILRYKRTSPHWEADHIVAVVEGGGLCGIENYRTLCTDCHKKASAELAARRAKARKHGNKCVPEVGKDILQPDGPDEILGLVRDNHLGRDGDRGVREQEPEA